MPCAGGIGAGAQHRTDHGPDPPRRAVGPRLALHNLDDIGDKTEEGDGSRELAQEALQVSSHASALVFP